MPEFLRAIPAVYEARVVKTTTSYKGALVVEFESLRWQLPPGELPQMTFAWVCNPLNEIAVANLRRFLETSLGIEIEDRRDAEGAAELVWGPRQILQGAVLRLETSRITTLNGREITIYNWLGRGDSETDLPPLPLAGTRRDYVPVPAPQNDAFLGVALVKPEDFAPAPTDTRPMEVRRFAHLEFDDE